MGSGVPATRHASMLMLPAPCASTLAATVPISGLRARMIGSYAGFRDVPQPSPMFRDFGKPEPYSQQSVSRISKPNSMDVICAVRVHSEGEEMRAGIENAKNGGPFSG